MDLQVEFSILSAAGTPASAPSCRFWLTSQAANWISCWHYLWDTPGLREGGQAAALPTRPSHQTSPSSEIQAEKGLCAKPHPKHHVAISLWWAAYPSIPGQQQTQPCLQYPPKLACPFCPHTWLVLAVRPQPSLFYASQQAQERISRENKAVRISLSAAQPKDKPDQHCQHSGFQPQVDTSSDRK